MRFNLLSTLTILAAAFLLSACQKETAVPNPPVSTGAAASNVVVIPQASGPEFAKLMGRWERPDGGYVLELRSVDAAGNITAGYFNPSPINVERAVVTMEGDVVKVFALLRDVNYPGCTYKLTYDPKTDQLFGQYFQASLQETYDVTFARLK